MIRLPLVSLGLILAANAQGAEIARTSFVATLASAEVPGRIRTLATGAGLDQNELVRTDASGRADLAFVDGTKLTVGPASSVRLDSFVYQKGSAAKFVLEATRGLFRFTTGNLPKRAYQIRTPVGDLGVRGTDFTFRVEAGRVVVSVSQGAVIACRGSGGRQRCQEARPGQSLVATGGGIVRRATSSLPRGLSLPRLAPLGRDGRLLRAGSTPAGGGINALPGSALERSQSPLRNPPAGGIAAPVGSAPFAQPTPLPGLGLGGAPGGVGLPGLGR